MFKTTLLLLVVLLTLASCSGLDNDSNSNVPLEIENAKIEKNLVIQFNLPALTRAIVVETFKVTSIKVVVVKNSTGEEVANVLWNVDQGSTIESIQIDVAGEYTITATHYGENENGKTSATESSTFSINPYYITTIKIIPGQICQISALPKGLILWNTLDSNSDLALSKVGPSLLSEGDIKFDAAKFDKGIYISSDTLVANSAVAIPADVLPRGNHTIEFWYTRKQDFTEGEEPSLLAGFGYASLTHPFASNADGNNHYSLRIDVNRPGFEKPTNSKYKYSLQLYTRYSEENVRAVNVSYNIGCTTLDDLHRYFPIGVPVHIAITRDNASGVHKIYVNGSELTDYAFAVGAYFVTSWDYSYNINLSGTFDEPIILGNYVNDANYYPACGGTIDDIKIYQCIKKDFSTY